MSRQNLQRYGVVTLGVILASGAALVGLLWPSSNSTPRASGEPTTASSTSTTTTTQPHINANDLANQIASVFKGYNPGELAIGSQNVTFDGAPEERGTAAFSPRTLKTQADVAGFLGENTDVGKAARQRVEDAIRKAGYGDGEVSRAMDGSGYFPIQAKVASQIMGTTYFQDGKVLEAGNWRQVGPDDVFWLFLTKDGKVIFGAAIRADCGNPHLTEVVPIRPGVPVGPPVEIPPGAVCPYDKTLPVDSPKCLQPKDANELIDRNPGVPDQVTKTGSSGDNQQQIDTGFAAPVDSPNGCTASPCPGTQTTQTTSPAPTQTTVVVPSCGLPGQPACESTGVTTPTTTTTPAPPPQTTPNDGTVGQR